MLEVFVQRIISNLKNWAHFPHVIEVTLNFFSDLATGYSPSRLLLKLDITENFLSFHTAEYFPFLDYPENLQNRSHYYASLGRLLFLEDNLPKFDMFVVPWSKTFRYLASMNSPQEMATQNSRETVIRLLRDLTGFISGMAARRVYNLFFEWIYTDNKFTEILARVIEVISIVH